jgi:hypothetical protein
MSRRDRDPVKQFRSAREARQVAERLRDEGLRAFAVETSSTGDDLMRRTYWIVEIEADVDFGSELSAAKGVRLDVTQYVRADGFIR